MTISEAGTEPKLKRELAEYSKRLGTDGPYADNLDIDVLVIGGGFGGIFCMEEMRRQGFRTVLYEAGTGFGGTWRWNCYPGARVDSEVPLYEFSWPEVYKDWTWSTNYPDHHELRAYFDHCDKVLNLSKDCSFSTTVVGAEFDEAVGKWTVKTADGRTCKTRFLIIAAGFASKRYIPDWPGIENFKGEVHHSSFWPDSGIGVDGKRAACIGTGASGVQISQEWGPKVASLKVFQRTPNLALPMGKRPLTAEEQNRLKPTYPEIHYLRERCFAGFHYDFHEYNTFEVTAEEREAFYEKIWAAAGFRFWLANFQDYLFSPEANRSAYDFWAKKQRARIRNSKKKDLLCPLEPPHPFGVKRPCLEQNYYEVLDQDNVAIVDISAKSGRSIQEFTTTGIKLSDGTEYELDIVAIATGFDVVTGGIVNMGLKSVHGKYLSEEWRDGAETYLGTTISGYPNMFHLYDAPTLLSNGPSCVEVQGRWIRDAICMAQNQGLKFIDPTLEAQKAFKQRINDLYAPTLLPTTKSTYMGGTVPGKKQEPVCYGGGVHTYRTEIRSALSGWKGFRTAVHA